MKLAKCHPEKAAKGPNRLCNACYLKEWSDKNPERVKAIQKTRQEKDKKSPERRLKKYYQVIKRKYNLLPKQYESMLSEQNNCCKICYKDPALGKRLHVDHDHKDNKVRGLLCAECNWFLGKIDKDVQLLNRLFLYALRIGMK